MPYLGIVGSEAITREYTDRFLSEIKHDNKSVKVIDGGRHVPTYDKDIYVDQAVEHLSSFYKASL